LNVIQERFFDIPLTQVCIPGLHINLGIIFKFVKEMEATSKKLDFKINMKMAMENNHVTGEIAESNVEKILPIY